MGRGDRRTGKGKRYRKSYGNTRINPRKLRRKRKDNRLQKQSES